MWYTVIYRDIPWYSVIYRDIPLYISCYSVIYRDTPWYIVIYRAISCYIVALLTTDGLNVSRFGWKRPINALNVKHKPWFCRGGACVRGCQIGRETWPNLATLAGNLTQSGNPGGVLPGKLGVGQRGPAGGDNEQHSQCGTINCCVSTEATTVKLLL